MRFGFIYTAEDLVLFAAVYAIQKNGYRPVHPKRIFDYIIVDARTGKLRTWKSIARVADRLVNKRCLGCQGRAGSRLYTVTKEVAKKVIRMPRRTERIVYQLGRERKGY